MYKDDREIPSFAPLRFHQPLATLKDERKIEISLFSAESNDFLKAWDNLLLSFNLTPWFRSGKKESASRMVHEVSPFYRCGTCIQRNNDATRPKDAEIAADPFRTIIAQDRCSFLSSQALLLQVVSNFPNPIKNRLVRVDLEFFSFTSPQERKIWVNLHGVNKGVGDLFVIFERDFATLHRSDSNQGPSDCQIRFFLIYLSSHFFQGHGW